MIPGTQPQPTFRYPLGHSIPQSYQAPDEWHRLFLTTNESNHERTLEVLARSTTVGNALLGPFNSFLLNAAAVRGANLGARNIEHIIICDRSSAAEQFCFQLKETMEAACESNIPLPLLRETVVDEIEAILEEGRDTFFPRMPSPTHVQIAQLYAIQALKAEIRAGTSWLSDDTRLARILKIFREQKFHFIRMDLTNPAIIPDLIQELSQRHITIDTLYTSNIEQYANRVGEGAYYTASVEQLLPQTLGYWVDAIPCTKTAEGRVVQQRIRLAPHLQQQPTDLLPAAHGSSSGSSQANGGTSGEGAQGPLVGIALSSATEASQPAATGTQNQDEQTTPDSKPNLET